MILADATSLPVDPVSVIVVGAGPAGIVQALELRRRGLEVNVLAGGVDRVDPNYQALADVEIADPRRHAPMGMAVARALGGTSLLWGGRCVAFDDVDFRARPHVPNSGWPLPHSEIYPWYAVAARYLDAGAPVFAAPTEELPNTPECRFDQMERWSEVRNLRRLHRVALSRDKRLQIHLGVVAVGLEIDPVSGRVGGVVAAMPSGERCVLRARAVVLACGGLETTRLLLAAQSAQPRLFGGASGALGRYYMGHAGGQIADVVLAPSVSAGAFSFFVDDDGRYVRRRITIAEAAQDRYGLLNLAAFPTNPPLEDPAHRSSILSLAYLSLATPGLGRLLAPEMIRRKHLEGGVRQVTRHLRNVLSGLPMASYEAARFLHGRYLTRPRLPGFEISNRARRYDLYYHAEQMPNPASTVRIGDGRDRLGMPRLRVDLRFDEIEARSIVGSHAVIDRNLRQARLGRLQYKLPENERMAAVLDLASDGYHQIGTTRMSANPAGGVVDRDCRVHGTPNLFIASSSVFPTSGQANPTLLVAALSARLAEHIGNAVLRLPEVSVTTASALEPALTA
jgi:choline dehydrogenase-like flavoprotein